MTLIVSFIQTICCIFTWQSVSGCTLFRSEDTTQQVHPILILITKLFPYKLCHTVLCVLFCIPRRRQDYVHAHISRLQTLLAPKRFFELFGAKVETPCVTTMTTCVKKPDTWILFQVWLYHKSHLKRDKIESILSEPGIQKCHEKALYKSFEASPHLICLKHQHPFRASLNPDLIQRLALKGPWC